MAALLVAIAVMAIAMTVAMPAWRQAGQREKEEELIFRGRQYVRAIQLYQRKFAATYPADIEILVKQKFLRKKYKDPMVEGGEFDILYQGSLVSIGQGRGGLPQGQGQGQGQGPGRGGATTFTFDSRSGGVTQAGQTARTVGPRGGVLGVRSKSTEASIRTYEGATHYNEWRFLFLQAMTGPGQGRPGMRGGPAGGQRGGEGQRPGGGRGPDR
jgi:type II secretory pathway pseudopilin PulG